MNALEFKNLVKAYGATTALAGLDLNVREGEVYGFLGRNGAGKSTALRIAMGISRADAGQVVLFNQTLKGSATALRRQIGYVAQEQHFYEWMSVRRLGKFVAGFYPGWDKDEFKRLLNSLDVPLERKVRALSGGMAAKLALAVALAHRPRLLLLDEPTAGMDPVARREFIAIVRNESLRAGRTTLFSSHLIDEVEAAADTVGVLDQGRMRYQGGVEQLCASVIRLKLACEQYEDAPLPSAVLESGASILQDRWIKGIRSVTVQLPAEQTLPTPYLLASAWELEQPSLEDIFIDMVSKTDLAGTQ